MKGKLRSYLTMNRFIGKMQVLSEDQKLDYRSPSKVFYNESGVELAFSLASDHSHSHATGTSMVHNHQPWCPYLQLLTASGHSGTVFMGLLHHLSILVFYNRENRSDRKSVV